MRYSEVEEPDGHLEWLIRKDGCMHCEDPGCLKACPAPGAIVQYSNGIVDSSPKTASAAAIASRAAHQHPTGLAEGPQGLQVHAVSDRVAVGQRRCAKACPTQAIPSHQGRHDPLGGARIADLKERGYENAGLYDPQGVGGTHVMYVLKHLDRPDLCEPSEGAEDQRRWSRRGKAAEAVRARRNRPNGAHRLHALRDQRPNESTTRTKRRANTRSGRVTDETASRHWFRAIRRGRGPIMAQRHYPHPARLDGMALSTRRCFPDRTVRRGVWARILHP